MANVDIIPVPRYNPTDPYNHLIDNGPIDGLISRIYIVNDQLNVVNNDLSLAVGTQGTLANRLSQGINDNGTLKTTAIDNALHSIAQHLDGGGYVRMTIAERTKLSLIQDQATRLLLQVSTISTSQLLNATTVAFAPSDSITWRLSGSQVFADTNFPTTVRHSHYYGLVPVASNLVTPDYKNYVVTSTATAYRAGSLRVIVNGTRLSPNVSTYVPMGVPSPTWTAYTYTEGLATNGIVTSGTFVLSPAINASTTIVVDFDVLFS